VCPGPSKAPAFGIESRGNFGWGFTMRSRCYAFAILVMAGCAASAFAQQTCDAYFAKSLSIKDLISDAYAAMEDGNLNAQKKVLPSLEPMLNTLPAAEVKPEVCNGAHINAYTTYRSAELGFL